MLRIISSFVLIDVIFIVGGQSINCPKENIKLEKVLGLRPADSNHPLTLYRANDTNDGNSVPVTRQCIEKCQQNSECRTFVIYYNVSTCYWYRNAIEGGQELENVIDTNSAWFVKVCLNVSIDCLDKLWTFERIPGATLIGNNTRTLASLLTRAECQQRCLNESKFECRSAKFKLEQNHGSVKGVCTLSATDRHQSPTAYRVSAFDEEYFENQCVSSNENTLNDPTIFCAYEEYENATLQHTDVYYPKQTKETCQKLCEDNKSFNCRSFSIVRRGRENYDCFLNSEDSKVQGPRILVENPRARYYERAQCINISIQCTETYMTVTYTPRVDFVGAMYMQGYSEHPECAARGRGLDAVTLRLPIVGQQCGIIQANGPDNRTLMAGTMILQYNAVIQTQSDRTIRVGCVYGNDSKVLVGTGITITTAPNKGSALINTTNAIASPIVEMRVLDFNTQQEVSSTQIGQELQLVIEIKPANGSYDIWAGHLVSMTENSEESILLLDDRGCPTNINVFPPLTKVVTNETRKLEATFQAFKFSSSPIVRFSVIVQFCNFTCPAVDCGTNGQSFGRRKRAVHVVDDTKIEPVNRQVFESRHQMPLEYIMVVRDPGVTSDKYVLSDGKILIAGYDLNTNEVCMDYSLVIGLIVTWLLIQTVFVVCCIILVRRYKRLYREQNTTQSLEELHKNFGYGFDTNRRVHWADNNSDYT